MDRSLRRLLATALFATGLSVPTLATAAPATAAVPVRLLAPAEGTVLQGGATAVLAWAPRPGLRGEWEEWEAFFSLDGGATYPFRLTPHLDRDLRRVSFKVPGSPPGRGVSSCASATSAGSRSSSCRRISPLPSPPGGWGSSSTSSRESGGG